METVKLLAMMLSVQLAVQTNKFCAMPENQCTLHIMQYFNHIHVPQYYNTAF